MFGLRVVGVGSLWMRDESFFGSRVGLVWDCLGFGFRVSGFGFRVSGPGLTALAKQEARVDFVRESHLDLGYLHVPEHEGTWVWGLRFGVSDFGFRVGDLGLGFRVEGWWIGVWGLGCGVSGLGFRVWGLEFGVSGLGVGLRVESGVGVRGMGSGVWGLGFGVWSLG